MLRNLRVGLAVSIVAACSRAPAPLAIGVPATKAALTLDGELGEQDWLDEALVPFHRSGSSESARPHSEARFLHDAKNLYVGLYAADEDLRHDDEFVLRLDAGKGAREVAFPVSGSAREIGGWKSGVALAMDVDGTVDDASDDDEEWGVEASIPLASLGAVTSGAKIAFSVRRCDRTKDGVVRCGETAGVLLLK